MAIKQGCGQRGRPTTQPMTTARLDALIAQEEEETGPELVFGMLSLLLWLFFFLLEF